LQSEQATAASVNLHPCRTDVFMLPVVTEEGTPDAWELDGSLGLVLGRHLYHKLSSDVDDEFDLGKAIGDIAAAVREKITRPSCTWKDS
jgi:hypothetical protein